MFLTCQHVLVPCQNFLLWHIDGLARLIDEYSVGVHNSVRRDIGHFGRIDEGHVGGKFAIDRAWKSNTTIVSLAKCSLSSELGFCE